MNKLKKFFIKSKIPKQRQYEALRSLAMDKSTSDAVAKKCGYSVSTLYSLVRDFKAGKLTFFPLEKHGPTKRQTPEHVRQLVINYRNENLSAKDIHALLKGHKCSLRTVERILKDAKSTEVHRRTFAERGKTLKNTIISERSRPLDFIN